jgi:hypothetical protein
MLGNLGTNEMLIKDGYIHKKKKQKTTTTKITKIVELSATFIQLAPFWPVNWQRHPPKTKHLFLGNQGIP